MAQIFNSLKTLIEPELSKAARTPGEPTEQVSAAVEGILPGILAKIFHKGPSGSVDNAITAGDGGKLIRSLFGNHTDDFNAHIARQSGLGKEHATQLVILIAGTVAVFLKSKNLKGAALIDDLGHEMDNIKGAIPENMKDIPLTMLGQRRTAAVTAGKKKRGLAWLWWLLGLLGLLLLALLIFLF